MSQRRAVVDLDGVVWYGFIVLQSTISIVAHLRSAEAIIGF
jgi:hypothetical protein